MSDYSDKTKMNHVENWLKSDKTAVNYMTGTDDLVNTNPRTFDTWVKEYFSSMNSKLADANERAENALKSLENVEARVKELEINPPAPVPVDNIALKEICELSIKIRDLQMKNEALQESNAELRRISAEKMVVNSTPVNHDTTANAVLQDRINSLETALRIADNAFEIIRNCRN